MKIILLIFHIKLRTLVFELWMIERRVGELPRTQMDQLVFTLRMPNIVCSLVFLTGKSNPNTFWTLDFYTRILALTTFHSASSSV